MTGRIIIIGLGLIFASASAAVIALNWPNIRPALGLTGLFLVLYLLILLGWLLSDSREALPHWQKLLQAKSRSVLKLIPFVLGAVAFYFAYRMMVWLEWDWRAAGIFALVVGGLFAMQFVGEAVIGGIFLAIGGFLWRYEAMRWILTALLLAFTGMVIFGVFFTNWFAS